MPFNETTITVSAAELDGSPTEEWTEDGRFRATRSLLVAWADRASLVAELQGNLVTLPHRYPDRQSAFVRSVSAERFHDGIVLPSGTTIDDGVGSYDDAVLTVEYAEPAEGEDPTTQVEERLEGSAEFLQLPAEGLRWGSADSDDVVPPTAVPGKLLPFVDYVYTRNRVPFVTPAVFGLMGHVNQQAIKSLSLGVTFEAETLLYQSPSINRQIFSDGTTSGFNVTLRFSVRPEPWNKFWRRDGGDDSEGAFDEIYDKEANARVRPFPLGDFSQIVIPDSIA